MRPDVLGLVCALRRVREELPRQPGLALAESLAESLAALEAGDQALANRWAGQAVDRLAELEREAGLGRGPHLGRKE